MDPVSLQLLISQYAAFGRFLISIGVDVAKGFKALFTLSRTPLTPAQQDQILKAVLAEASVREALALADAGKPVPILLVPAVFQSDRKG